MKQSLRWLALLFAVATGTNASPPVRVSLRSSWPAPSTLIEVLETVALENPDAFFPLVDRLTDPDVLQNPGSLSPEAIHQAALQIASSNGLLADTASLAAVEMNLALHAATPKIEAFYSYYEDHHDETAGTECGSWVDWYGQVVCDVETLAQLAGVETIDASQKGDHASFPKQRLLTFDHVLPSPTRMLQSPPRTAILYGSPSSPNFRELHKYLYSLADKENPHVQYVFRHLPPKDRSGAKNTLSGYGVALNLKKMDYLALDDRNTRGTGANKGSSLLEKTEELETDLISDLIQNFPENSAAPDAKTPLSEEEVLDVGHKATQLIANSTEPLIALTRLSQNFPKYATALSRRVVVNESVEAETHNNSLRAQPGAHVMWLNGIIVNEREVNPLGLLRLLKKERNTVTALTSLGLSRQQAFELLTHPSVVKSQQASDVLDGVFDASDRIEGGDVVVYWNDMEKDSRYSRWSPSLFGLLRMGYGGFPTIKLNLFNVVLVVDLSKPSTFQFIAGPMSNIIERTIPLRFGMVPVVETEDNKKMARVFYHLIKNYGRRKTLAFFTNLAEGHSADDTKVSWKTVEALYDDLAAEEESAPELLDIAEGKIADDAPLDKAARYARRLGANLATSENGHAFMNGRHFKFDDAFLRLMQQEFSQQMQFFQEKVYEGKITDADNETISTYFYDQPSASTHRNRYIHVTGAGSNLQLFNLPELFAKIKYQPKTSGFLYPPETGKLPLTTFVVADLDSEAGSNLVKEALASMIPGSHSRVGLIHNPSVDPSELTSGTTTSRLVAHLVSTNALMKASPALLARAMGSEEIIMDDDAQTVLFRDGALQKLTGGVKPSEFDAGQYSQWVKANRLLARELKLAPGQSAVVTNGRLVGPIEDNDFDASDFITLELYELRKRAEPVIQALDQIDATVNDKDKISYANTISMTTSIISAIQQPDPSENGLFNQGPRPRSKSYQFLDSEYTAFYAGDNSTAIYHISVLLDPLSETTQKWSSLLQWLSNIPDTFIEVHLNPARHTEIPLKSFYRYNLLPSLSFDNDGQEIPARVTFDDLPVEPIYTLAMDVPHSWLVRPREAAYDLDNLQLGHLLPGDRSVDAIFELDYLVIDGHSREAVSNSPPRGVQLELVQHGNKPVDDTLVVANLGYLQFKAKPGVFSLQIREGRGRDIFKMSSVGNEGWDSPSVEEAGSEITVTSFEGLTLYPKLARLPGKERADVLAGSDEDAQSHGLFGDIASRVTSLFKTKETAVAKVEEQAEINIFTVASGLLYERFASIMILSVLRNTNSTVKFWFIENFLSPSFLEFIPHMAEKYNFKYELVTYKWPSWLREQKEKQRIIWAYKILFLDVLFPMDLKKVIFVDADQIVRADLKELVDLDLHGAPYGYTPMGDDNTDMEGFRFWKTGYWKEFLQGRPYHISALYVVDLVRFRQMAAGDMLRGQYQQLSADPNSLANLDQDLPNNLQREVPIFSLGEDWLWCETWCSKDRLHRAKTIDLCQNPLTKEPKLSRARQIPEWEEYDGEIAKFTRQLADDGLIHSGMAAADVNALANAGSAPVVAEASEGDPEAPTEETDNKEEHPRDEL